MDNVEDTATDAHAVGPAEAFQHALGLQRSGHLDEAETLYTRILAVEPDYADALHFSGILQFQRGRPDEAILRIRRAIALSPGEPGMHNNLGNILLHLGRTDLAVQAFEATVAMAPGEVDARSNLAVALRSLGRSDEAEIHLREAVALDAGHRDAWNNLGRLRYAREDVAEAISCHEAAMRADRKDVDTKRYLVRAYLAAGRKDDALATLAAWRQDQPDDPSIPHRIAGITGEDVPPRANDRYVAELFDDFAKNFDSRLAMLEYRAPALVGDAVAQALGEPRRQHDVLDAGCGTGLCGPHLTPFARHLAGVDLSAEMLRRAELRGGYDTLVCAELTAYLVAHKEHYDLVVSADTLCYFGDLTDVLTAAADALREQGILVFTVEEESGDGPFKLHVHGRYSHRAEHVAETLSAAGLAQMAIARCHLRVERGRPVCGLLVTARKAPAS